MNKQKLRKSSRKGNRGLNARRKAGLPAKAGKRRPPSIKSIRDSDGKRQWVIA